MWFFTCLCQHNYSHQKGCSLQNSSNRHQLLTIPFKTLGTQISKMEKKKLKSNVAMEKQSTYNDLKRILLCGPVAKDSQFMK